MVKGNNGEIHNDKVHARVCDGECHRDSHRDSHRECHGNIIIQKGWRWQLPMVWGNIRCTDRVGGAGWCNRKCDEWSV